MVIYIFKLTSKSINSMSEFLQLVFLIQDDTIITHKYCDINRLGKWKRIDLSYSQSSSSVNIHGSYVFIGGSYYVFWAKSVFGVKHLNYGRTSEHLNDNSEK